MPDKFPNDQRTFETRLIFIKELFAHLYPQCEIMAKCINYKLDCSYENYFKAMNTSLFNLHDTTEEEALQIMKYIKF